METLSVLEKKVASLIDIIRQLKADNARLIEENAQIASKLTMMQGVVHEDAKRVEELDQEKALTKMLVDDLIKNIDSLVEGEKTAMMQDSGSYKVSIFGDQYTIKTDESPELIVQAATMVDSTMKEIACASKFDTKSIAVFAALKIAHQMMSADQNCAQNEALISFIDQELTKLGFNTLGE